MLKMGFSAHMYDRQRQPSCNVAFGLSSKGKRCEPRVHQENDQSWRLARKGKSNCLAGEELEYTGSCTRAEVISLLELPLWEMRMKNVKKEDPNCEIDRAGFQSQSGAGVVIEKMSGCYPWDDETKARSGLSMCPVCPTIGDGSE
mmetsp:Transcript_19199/g.47457  ORF Transcript_19199/g.47457 Transcript_19199/m.47457 type:complete len:145 (-) Transcript_19199:261-695(-)